MFLYRLWCGGWSLCETQFGNPTGTGVPYRSKRCPVVASAAPRAPVAPPSIPGGSTGVATSSADRRRRLPSGAPGAVRVRPRRWCDDCVQPPSVRHGARGGRCGSPLVIRQHFPLRARREMGADPCPQAEAGPTAPPWRQVRRPRLPPPGRTPGCCGGRPSAAATLTPESGPLAAGQPAVSCCTDPRTLTRAHRTTAVPSTTTRLVVREMVLRVRPSCRNHAL